MGKKAKAKTVKTAARTQMVTAQVTKSEGKPQTVAVTVVEEKALLKVFIPARVLRRVRMTAADQGLQPGDLVGEILDGSLPEWKPK